jgi:NAD(P)-dependent dehydrogenase (short-subunit alcohol dehydrogenase family)
MEVYNPFSLAGKKVLVTGASSGIGRAVAIVCSKMGGQLIITGRNK